VLFKKEFNQHFRGSLNYTYLDAKDLDTNDQLKPYHKWGFGLSYTDQIGDNQDDFTVGLDGYMVAGRPDGLENYYIVDANITRDFTLGDENDQKIKFSFSIKNLFDQRPELVSGYPIQGRTFMLGISTNF
jgi:outer membrane receptor protein involved in Fe transport